MKKIINLFREIKWFYQRGTRGYSEKDTWSIDWYILKIMIPMLQNLRDTHHGVPGELTDEEWIKILNDIIEGFKAGKRVIDLDYPSDDRDWVKHQKEDEETFNKAFELFHKWFFALWD